MKPFPPSARLRPSLAVAQGGTASTLSLGCPPLLQAGSADETWQSYSMPWLCRQLHSLRQNSSLSLPVDSPRTCARHTGAPAWPGAGPVWAPAPQLLSLCSRPGHSEEPASLSHAELSSVCIFVYCFSSAPHLSPSHPILPSELAILHTVPDHKKVSLLQGHIPWQLVLGPR